MPTRKKATTRSRVAAKKKTTTRKRAVTANDAKLDDGLLTNARQIHQLSVAAARMAIGKGLGQSFGGERDLYAVFGYPQSAELTYDKYRNQYDRHELSKAIIDKPVRKSWSQTPKIYDGGKANPTAFDNAWKELTRRLRVFHYFSRVDRLASLGKYAVLFLGFKDGADFEQPVTAGRELLYMMPYSEGVAKIATYETDTDNDRFGLPEVYEIEMGSGSDKRKRRVHHSRLIHVAVDKLDSEIEGTPVLRAPFNRLIDIEQVAGSSREGYWLGAFPGLGIIARQGANFDDEAAVSSPDKTNMTESIENYIHGFQRFMKLKGVDLEQLNSIVADPTNHIMVQIDLISAVTNIPKRILLGSERGELSSSQDTENWNDFISERREDFCEPQILRPTVDRLVEVNVLPVPTNTDDGFSVDWPDLSVTSDKEKAITAEHFARALAAYSDSIDSQNFVPFPVFAEHVLNWTPDMLEQLEAFVEEERGEANGRPGEVTEEPEDDEDEDSGFEGE